MSWLDPFGQGKRASREYRQKVQQEKQRLQALAEKETLEALGEQRTARQVHAERKANNRASMAVSGAVLSTGSTRAVDDAQIEAQALQESEAQRDFSDRLGVLKYAEGEAERQGNILADEAKEQAKANAIGFYFNTAMTAITAGTALGTGGAGVGGNATTQATEASTQASRSAFHGFGTTSQAISSTGGLVSSFMNAYGDLQTQDIYINVGNRRAGYQQWLAGSR